MPKQIYRITHFKNLEFILKNGLHCCNSLIKDPNFIGIGNPSIIDRRSQIIVPVDPKGVLNDYVPFYIGPRSPMLYQIFKGNAGGFPCVQEDIVYIVCDVQKVIDSKLQFVFTDGHAVDKLTHNFYNDIDLWETLDLNTIYGDFWKNTEDDMQRQRRKQSEFLVYQNVPINCILGIGVMNNEMKVEIEELLQLTNCENIPCKVKLEWYYF
ncbi:MAG: DUF4433 domain-containing protein [Ignavibacteria bacterium]|nr:DUF4433 domain-containing protein [Ignavibacteria bacterium]